MTDPKTVLIVDDESSTRVLISRVLRDRNFQLLQAENGQKALEILEGGQKVDLVLMDVMMPEMDGYEVLNKMAEKGLNKDVYVIMLTGLDTYPNVMKGYNVGADCYITKPFQHQTLLNIVDYLRKLPRQADSSKGDWAATEGLGRNVSGGTRPRLSWGRSPL